MCEWIIRVQDTDVRNIELDMMNSTGSLHRESMFSVSTQEVRKSSNSLFSFVADTRSLTVSKLEKPNPSWFNVKEEIQRLRKIGNASVPRSCGIWATLQPKMRHSAYWASWVFGGNGVHLVILLQPFHQVNRKAASFEWGPEQERTLQQVQAAVQVAHHIRNMAQQTQWCQQNIEILSGFCLNSSAGE